MERYYKIAGTTLCIKGKDDEMYTQERKIEPFHIEKTDADYEYDFSIEEKLSEVRGECIYRDASKRIYQDGEVRIQYTGVVKDNVEKAYIRSESIGNLTSVQIKRKELPDRITSKVVLNALGIESLIFKTGGFILHSAFINVDGKAILFTAPSGTGKSTQAELWEKFRHAEIINGDRAVIQIRDEKIVACGIPFSGSSEHCKNEILPIGAIVYLTQATETSIKPLREIQAFRKIWEQITLPVWETKVVEQISERLETVLKKVPVYYLSCTPDESAVIALENELTKEC